MTITTLIIARHGNTFNPGETPRRVGGRTDIALTESGKAQATALGQHLKQQELVPDVAYSSQQMRTIDTALLALTATERSIGPEPLEGLNELDYGPDENQPEDAVIARLGAQALKDWDEKAIVPTGWQIDPEEIKNFWTKFGHYLLARHAGQKILTVTSNGTARFAPHLTGDFDAFRVQFPLKLATGAYGVLQHDGNGWTVLSWNVRPGQ